MAKQKATDPWAVEVWAVSKLREYGANPRKNDQAVDQMAALIKKFGFRVPILAKSDGEIVDGHLRFKAAKAAKLKEVPVMLADDMTDAQIKAFRLSVNKAAELADWDMEMLRLELVELEALDFDIEGIGFSAEELDTLRFDDDSEAEMPDLEDGDREPFQQITFTLHDDQVEEIKAAMARSQEMGPFGDTGNENKNGNALARICEMFNANFGAPEGT